MMVCTQCAKYGIPIESHAVPRNISEREAKSLEVTEIAQNYAEMIRCAREERGWTQEELSKRINEKASLISKIERGKFFPDEKLRRKIETILDINLCGTIEDYKRRDEKRSKTLTFGDVVSIKKGR
jgi:putative transcription factor